MKENVSCNLCGEDSPVLLFEKDGFNIVRCSNCFLTYVNPRLKADQIRNMYMSADYFKRTHEGAGYRDYLADEYLHIKTFRREFDKIERITKGGNLLDVGCAFGFSLKEAARRGWNVRGVEISKVAAHYAKKKFHVDVFNGSLEDAAFEGEMFDLIICYGTVEHLTDPDAFFKEIYRLLKPGALFIVATPDISSWLGNRRFQYKPLEHLYYFSKKTY